MSGVRRHGQGAVATYELWEDAVGAAISAIRAKAGPGGGSRIWYRRSTFKGSASFLGNTGSSPEQSQTLAVGGRRS
jgi:hypothetical protein